MRRVGKVLAIVGAMALLWAPTPARADGFVSPFAGVTFGSDDLEDKFTWGVNAGWMGAGIIGGEIDFGYTPSPFGDAVDNHVLDVMGNLIIGIPIGGQSGPGIRPYVTGGLGMIQTKIASGVSNIQDYDTKDFGFNFGGGVMGYFSNHVGMRGDVRYMRTISDDNLLDNGLDINLGSFNFWRASIGLVIR